MRVKSLFIILSLFWLLALTVKAQWDMPIGQYWQTKTIFNPSFAGEKGAIDITALYRMQWKGADYEPKATLATANMPLKFLGAKHGIGVYYFNEKTKSATNNYMSFQYAYKHDIGEGQFLNLGLQYTNMSIEYDAGKVHHPGDSLIFLTGKKKTPDMTLGISWITPTYYIGASVAHLWEPGFKFNNEKSKVGRTYYLTGGYNVPIEFSPFVFKPSFFLKSDDIVTRLDLTALVEYNKQLTGGITWRKDECWVFSLGVRLLGIDAGYAYELPTKGKIAKSGNGTHEILVRYDIPLKRHKKVEGRHKSIRIL